MLMLTLKLKIAAKNCLMLLTSCTSLWRGLMLLVSVYALLVPVRKTYEYYKKIMSIAQVKTVISNATMLHDIIDRGELQLQGKLYQATARLESIRWPTSSALRSAPNSPSNARSGKGGFMRGAYE
jgi:hypothetical protein